MSKGMKRRRFRGVRLASSSADLLAVDPTPRVIENVVECHSTTQCICTTPDDGHTGRHKITGHAVGDATVFVVAGHSSSATIWYNVLDNSTRQYHYKFDAFSHEQLGGAVEGGAGGRGIAATDIEGSFEIRHAELQNGYTYCPTRSHHLDGRILSSTRDGVAIKPTHSYELKAEKRVGFQCS